MGKQEFWSKHILAQRRSGESQTKYCALHGLKASSFGYWASKSGGAISLNARDGA